MLSEDGSTEPKVVEMKERLPIKDNVCIAWMVFIVTSKLMLMEIDCDA
jgi:hypothetical protein